MESRKIFRLRNEFSELAERYHDHMVCFEVVDHETVIMKEVEEDGAGEICKIKLSGLVEENFVIYENREDDKLAYSITDQGIAKDIEECLMELVDVYASSNTLLIYGAKRCKTGYLNDVVLKLCGVESIEI